MAVNNQAHNILSSTAKLVRPRIVLKMDNHYSKVAALKDRVDNERATGLWSSKRAIYSWIQHPDAMTANSGATTNVRYWTRSCARALRERVRPTATQASDNESEESNGKRYIIRVERQKALGYKLLYKGVIVAVIPRKIKRKIISRIED